MKAYMHEHCVTLAWVREPELFYGRVLASAFEQKKTQSNQIKSHGIAPITSDRTRSHCPIPSKCITAHPITPHPIPFHVPFHPIPPIPSHIIQSKRSPPHPIPAHSITFLHPILRYSPPAIQNPGSGSRAATGKLACN